VGITPIMEAEQMRLLLDSIKVVRKVKISAKHGGGYKEVADLKGLRDRAAIAIMGYTFARLSAVVGLTLGDYRPEGKRGRLRLMEKGNKGKLVWLHREGGRIPGRLSGGSRRRGRKSAVVPDTG
jgi:integrase/recombinase XerD